jgi:branched-chain amino acid transport system permease protein
MNWDGIINSTLRGFFGIDACYFAIAAIGLNLQFGYTGLLNFGQAAFLACGAYGVGMATFYFGVSMWWGIAFGLGFSVLLGLLMGIPTLRLRADYLAMVTISIAEVVRLFVRSQTFRNVFGGADGISDFSQAYRDLSPFQASRGYGLGPFQNDGVVAWLLALMWLAIAALLGFAAARSRRARERGPQVQRAVGIGVTVVIVLVMLWVLSRLRYSGYTMWTLTLGWALVAVLALFLWLLMRSPFGRVLKAIREDEDAVRSLGKGVYSYKMQALIMGGAIGMLAGVVRALDRGSVQPDNYGRDVTFYIMTALVLGGLATVTGSIVGPMLFWAVLVFTDSFLNELVGSDGVLEVGGITLIENVTQIGQIRFAFVGLALMLLMILRPQGLFGNRKEMALDGR